MSTYTGKRAGHSATGCPYSSHCRHSRKRAGMTPKCVTGVVKRRRPGAAEEKKPANATRVQEATYCGNCTGVAKGNVTKFIASACDGTDLCNYRVYYKNMGGDPAVECKKAFRVGYCKRHCGRNWCC